MTTAGTVDLVNDLGIEADARHEREELTIDPAEVEPLDRTRGDGLGQPRHRGTDLEKAGDQVLVAEGQERHGQSGGTIEDRVERSVAARRDDAAEAVDARPRRLAQFSEAAAEKSFQAQGLEGGDQL